MLPLLCCAGQVTELTVGNFCCVLKPEVEVVP